jgi:hypothetical protein
VHSKGWSLTCNSQVSGQRQAHAHLVKTGACPSKVNASVTTQGATGLSRSCLPQPSTRRMGCAICCRQLKLTCSISPARFMESQCSHTMRPPSGPEAALTASDCLLRRHVKCAVSCCCSLLPAPPLLLDLRMLLPLLLLPVAMPARVPKRASSQNAILLAGCCSSKHT